MMGRDSKERKGLRKRHDLREEIRLSKRKGPWAMILLSAAVLMLGLSACSPDAGRAVGTDAEGTDRPGHGSDGNGKKGLGGSDEEGIDEKVKEVSESYNTEWSYDLSGESADPGGEAPRQLKEEELRYFEQYLNQADNYGFLLSEYKTPEYLDLNEVFYSGAGLEQSAMTGEERDAFLNAVGQTEIMTDMVRLDKKQIDAFLLDKTGLTLDQMKTGLGWVYLPQYDRYYTQHGDTNIRSFFCPKGEADGNLYRIWCLSDGYTQFSQECMVTLKKESSGYQFLSNEIIWDYYGYHKADASAPTTEALHYNVSAYKRQLKEGAAGGYPAGGYPVDYGLPVFDSDTRYYTREEMRQISWTPELTAVFRNEIYARHGYIFKNDIWNDFFSTYIWYSGIYSADKFDAGVFNEYEKENLKLAVEMEQ
ncbi:YARHG domain-containing protein [Enterocloster aldenensis]|uniref:YARHG domain-containing protein n=2 Tax=Enterocloster aldenensis TaxID=358742 RepID=A0AAW5C5Y0_9FIRM|nr:YARHG domain-containing protein [Enterocloster aldenensis]